MLKIKKKIKAFIINLIGLNDIINDLRDDINKKNTIINDLTNRYHELTEISIDISNDNKVLRKHIEFINSNFVVTADVAPQKRGNHVVLIMQKNGNQQIKQYTFSNEQMGRVFDLVEGFGKNNIYIDDGPQRVFRHRFSDDFRF